MLGLGMSWALPQSVWLLHSQQQIHVGVRRLSLLDSSAFRLTWVWCAPETTSYFHFFSSRALLLCWLYLLSGCIAFTQWWSKNVLIRTLYRQAVGRQADRLHATGLSLSAHTAFTSLIAQLYHQPGQDICVRCSLQGSVTWLNTALGFNGSHCQACALCPAKDFMQFTWMLQYINPSWMLLSLICRIYIKKIKLQSYVITAPKEGIVSALLGFMESDIGK